MSEVAAITESMLAAMDAYIARAVAPLKEKIAALEKRVAEIPAPAKGEHCDMAAVENKLSELVAAIPRPKDGEQGKDADPDVIAAMVGDAVAALPPPKQGEPGKDVDPTVVANLVTEAAKAMLPALVTEAASKIQVPKDGEPGKDADPEEVSNLVAETIRSAILPEMIDKAIAALPKAKDGEPGKDATPAVSVTFGSINADGHLLLGMSDGKCIDVGMVKGERGKDGEPGSVALGDHTVWGLDAKRSYTKGTWALHAGALLHAARTTGPISDGLEAAGWEVAFEVPQDFSMELGDDMRTLTQRSITASGMRLTLVKKLPVVLDREMWKAGTYEKGDAVTFDGSLWIARRDTTARPGESDDWRLSARKGRDGRNADGSRAAAERGPVRLK